MNAWWHEVWVTLQAEFADIGASPSLGVRAPSLCEALLSALLLRFGRGFVRSWSVAHQPPSGRCTMSADLFA